MGIFSDAIESPDFMDPADGEFEDPAFRMSYASVEEDDYALGTLRCWVHQEIRDAGLVHRFSRLHSCGVQIRARHQRETIWH